MKQRPTEIVEEEHKVIQKVVSTIAVLTEELGTGRHAAQTPAKKTRTRQ